MCRREDSGCGVEAADGSPAAKVPGDAVTSRSTGTAPADEPGAVPDLSSPGGVLEYVLTTVISTVVYVPFCVAVLCQTAASGSAVDTKKWQEQVSGGAWAVGLLAFAIMVAGPCIVLPLTDGPVLEYVLRAVVFSLIVITHSGTVLYTTLRKDLGKSGLAGRLNQARYSVCCGFLSSTINPLNWRNWVSMASIFVEFAQLASMAVPADVVAATSDGSTESSGTMTSVQAALLYLRFVWHDELDVTHPLGPVIFQFLPGAMFISIISRLVRGTASASTSIAIGSYLCLCFYATTAGFVGAYVDNEVEKKGDLVYAPRYMVKERMAKGLLGGIAGLLSAQVTQACALVVTISLYLGILVTRPCSNGTGNWLRMFFLQVAMALLAAALILSASATWTEAIITAVTVFAAVSALVALVWVSRGPDGSIRAPSFRSKSELDALSPARRCPPSPHTMHDLTIPSPWRRSVGGSMWLTNPLTGAADVEDSMAV